MKGMYKDELYRKAIFYSYSRRVFATKKESDVIIVLVEMVHPVHNIHPVKNRGVVCRLHTRQEDWKIRCICFCWVPLSNDPFIASGDVKFCEGGVIVSRIRSINMHGMKCQQKTIAASSMLITGKQILAIL